jgi:cytochrome c556
MRLVSALTIAALIGAFGAGIASAQQKNPIEERQAIMKSYGREATAMSKMVKGELPYDAAKVNAAFTTWEDGTKKLPELFPPDSKTGHDTRALPKIWTDTDEFKKHLMALAKDVAAEKSKAASGLDGLKQAMAVVGKDCKGCHDEFRAEKK